MSETARIYPTDAEALGAGYTAHAAILAERQVFRGIGGLDAYNPSIPFEYKGCRCIAVRLEERNSHVSHTRVFREEGKQWVPVEEASILPLEDPFFSNLNDKPYLGGVEFLHGKWRTLLYDVSDLCHPELVFTGPYGMKDLRFCTYPDGRIGIFTRPQGGPAGRGTVGYTEVRSIDDIQSVPVADAPLIGNTTPDSWEGVNQAICLNDDKVLLIGHVAWMENGDIRHYYAARSVFYRQECRMDPWTVILKREELPPGPVKRPDLSDVLFPGGLELSTEDRAILFLGVSDTECWCCDIPFLIHNRNEHQ